jgi:recombinational DNA repair ATPase RecF
VLSDLDESRRREIFALALGGGGQTFLTTTDLDALPAEARRAATVWSVTSGRVEPAGGG